MTSLTIRGLLSRKARALLTGLAVLLGVAMISGTYVFTDTINSTFDKVFEEGRGAFGDEEQKEEAQHASGIPSK